MPPDGRQPDRQAARDFARRRVDERKAFVFTKVSQIFATRVTRGNELGCRIESKQCLNKFIYIIFCSNI